MLAAHDVRGFLRVCAETVWLSSLDLKQMTTGWSVPKADRGIAGKPISIGGKQFAHGVGTHADSKLRVNLGGNAQPFLRASRRGRQRGRPRQR